MLLTLTQFLLLVLTIAAVVAVTFFVILMIQLKRTASEGEKTLIEIRSLVQNLQQTSLKVNTKIDDMGEVVEATKKTAVSLSEAALFLSAKVLKPSSKYWPFLFPLIRIGWRQLKKKKEDKKGV